MLTRAFALVLSVAVALAGCASAGGPRVAAAPAFGPQDRAVLADYVQKLPAGSRVRVERTTGGPIRGTLMKATAQSVIVQKNTRLPEPPVEVPLDQISRVSLDVPSGGLGKMLAIGAGVGAAGTFATLLILAALLGD